MNADDRKRLEDLERRLDRRDDQIDRLAELMTGAVGAVADALQKQADAINAQAALRREIATLNEGLRGQQTAVIRHALELRKTAQEQTQRVRQILDDGGAHGSR